MSHALRVNPRRPRRDAVTAALVAATVLSSPGSAAEFRLVLPDGYDWTEPVDQMWSNEDNWKIRGRTAEDPPGVATGIGQDVFIADPAESEVLVEGANQLLIGSLTALTPIRLQTTLALSDDSLITGLTMFDQFGALEVNAPTSLLGPSNSWTRGPIFGTAPLTVSGQLLLKDGTTKTIDTEFRNQGTISQLGGTLNLGANLPTANLVNTGSFQGNGLIARASGSDARVIMSGGSITAIGGSLTLGTPVDLDGGTLGADTGSTLRFSRGFQALGATVLDTGDDGAINIFSSPGAEPYVIGGEIIVRGDGTTSVTTPMEVESGASLIVETGSTADFGLSLSSTLTVDGALVVSQGVATALGGMIDGSGTVGVTSGSLLRTSNGGGRNFSVPEVLIDGAFWHENGATTLGDTTDLTVGSTGVMEIRNGGISGGTVVNRGSIIRPSESPNNVFSINSVTMMEAGALVSNDRGIVRFNGDGDWSGITVLTADGAETEVRGVVAADGDTTLEGGGRLEVGTGGTLQVGTALFNRMSGSGGGFTGLALASTNPLAGDGFFSNAGRIRWETGRISLGSPGSTNGLFNEPRGSLDIVGAGCNLGGIIAQNGGEFRIETGLGLDEFSELRILNGPVDFVDGGLGPGAGSNPGTAYVYENGSIRRPLDSTSSLERVRVPLRFEGSGKLEALGGDLRVSEGLFVRAGEIAKLEAAAGRVIELATNIQGGVAAEGDPADPSELRVEAFAGLARLVNGSIIDITVRSFGATELAGAAFQPSARWNIFGEARWLSGTLHDGQASGLLVVEGGSSKTLTGTLTVNVGTVSHNAGSIVNAGRITVDDGIWVAVAGLIDDGGGEFVNGGEFVKLESSNYRVETSFDNAGFVEVQAGTLTLDDILQIVDGTLLGGDWKILPGAVLNTPPFIDTIGPQARVRIGGDPLGSFPSLWGLETNEGDLVYEGLLQGPIQNRGTLELLPAGADIGELLRNESDADRSLIGDLVGVISLADGPIPRLTTPRFENAGRVIPGGAGNLGAVAITGDVILESAGLTVLDLGETGGDIFDVDGDVQLGGTLRLDGLEDWQPAIGTQVTVLTATGAVAGRFEDVVSPDLGTWAVTVNGGTVTATLTGGPTCPRDVDQDGDVGLSDLLTVLADWGFCPSCAADVDGDDEVGLSDLLGVIADWGPCGG